MSRKRKEITMIVTVSAEAGTSNAIADVARNHVRVALIDGLADQGHGTKVKSVKPAGPILAAARKAWEAWGGGPRPRTPRVTPPLLKAMGIER